MTTLTLLLRPSQRASNLFLRCPASGASVLRCRPTGLFWSSCSKRASAPSTSRTSREVKRSTRDRKLEKVPCGPAPFARWSPSLVVVFPRQRERSRRATLKITQAAYAVFFYEIVEPGSTSLSKLYKTALS